MADNTSLYPIAVIAKLFNMTDRNVRYLTEQGIISKAARGMYPLGPTVQKYVQYLQEKANGRNPDNNEYEREKTLLYKANRQKAELELMIMRGELHRSDDVKRVMNDMLAAFRTRCLALPTKLAPRILGQTDLAVVRDAIKKDVYEALAELADYDPEVFYKYSKDNIVLSDDGEEAEPPPVKEPDPLGQEE